MTSPAQLGTIAQFKLGAVDISGDSNSIGLSAEVGEEDITVFGDYWHEYLPTLGQAQIDLNAFYDSAAGKNAVTQWAMMPTASAPPVASAFTYNPLGGASGKPTYTGTVNIRKYNPQSKPAGALVLNSAFRVTGPVSRGTIA